MKKIYISVLNFISMETQILCAEGTDLRATELRDEEDALDSFLTGHEVDMNNCNYMQTGEFPLNLQHSNFEVLDKINDVVRKEVIRRIEERFEIFPDKTVTFGERRIIGESEECTLSYREGVFFWTEFNTAQVKLGDFCTEDLLFILEKIK